MKMLFPRLASCRFLLRLPGLGLVVCACFLLFCSCATPPSPRVDSLSRTNRPADALFNQGAGRGDFLFLTLRWEDGRDLLFVVDTGCPGTILDTTLEPLLGKCLAQRKVRYAWFGKATVGEYHAPPLYLGQTRLLVGDRVVVDDLSRICPGRPVMGILGMDCLRHYCLQLDFVTRQMRFLDPDDPKPQEWGQAFPLEVLYQGRRVYVRENLLGTKGTRSLIDTGCYIDGAPKSKSFERELQEQRIVSTNQWKTPGGTLTRKANFPKGKFGGETYSDLMLNADPTENVIGLRFLARHLVTFNFPKATMHLQRKTAGPLTSEKPSTNIAAATLGWWEREGAKADDGQSLADRLSSAPGLHPGGPLPASFWWRYYQPQFRPLRISVGPPEARLSMVELPPGQYPLKFVSRVNRNARGEAELSLKYLHDGSGPATPVQERGTIFLLHGYNSQKESLVWWAFLLAEAGYRVVLVDLRGHGESSGQTVSFGKYETADLRQVLDALIEQRVCATQVGVLGVGWGADLAMHWAARDSRVGAVVAIAPNIQPEQAFTRLARDRMSSVAPELLRDAMTVLAARLSIDWADWSSQTAVRQLKRPVLLIGGGRDAISHPDDLQVLERAAPAGSQSLIIPEANRRDVAYWFHETAQPVKAWFQTHLSAE